MKLKCKEIKPKSTAQKITEDTFNFLLGTVIGLVINFIFQRVLQLRQESMMNYCLLGLVQVGVNAYTVLMGSFYLDEPGFFTMGVLSSQEMLIKKCYK